MQGLFLVWVVESELGQQSSIMAMHGFFYTNQSV